MVFVDAIDNPRGGCELLAIAGMPQSNAPANTNLENERRGFIVIFWNLVRKDCK